MRVLLLCLLCVVSAAGAADPKETCGPLDNLWLNLNSLFWNPTIGRLSLVMHGTEPVPPDKLLHCQNHTRCKETRCDAIGITTSADVLATLLHALLGVDVSGFLLFTSPELRNYSYVLDVCPRLTTAYELNPTGLPMGYRRAECAMATSMVRCAVLFSVWLVPWLLGIVTLVSMLVVACTCCVAGFQ